MNTRANTYTRCIETADGPVPTFPWWIDAEMPLEDVERLRTSRATAKEHRRLMLAGMEARDWLREVMGRKQPG